MNILTSVGLLTGSAACASAILFLSGLRKNKELIKAKIFLLYDKVSLLAILGLLLGIVGVLSQMVIIALGLEDGYLSLESFLGGGFYTMAAHAGIIFVCMTVYSMLRTVGK